MHPHETPTTSAADLPEGAALLDVREPEEWEAGHLAGSQHLPIGEVLERWDEVPVEGVVVVVCRSGHRSGQVAAYLSSRGVEALNLDGGLLEWDARGGALVTDDGSPGRVL